MDGIRSDSGFRQHLCDEHEIMKSIFIFYLTVLKLLEGEDTLVSVVEGYYRQQSQGKSVKTTTKVLGFFKYDEFSESTVGHREYYCIFWVEKICTKGEYTFSCDVCVCRQGIFDRSDPNLTGFGLYSPLDVDIGINTSTE